MKNLVRVAAVVNRVTPANPEESYKSAKMILSQGQECEPDIIVFPSEFLAGSSAGDAANNRAITERVAEISAEISLSDDRIILSDKKFPVFLTAGELNAAVIQGDADDLAVIVSELKESEIDVIILCCSQTVRAGKISLWRNTAKNLSETLNCAIVINNGGIGESTSSYIYSAFCGIWQCGEELAFQVSADEPFVACADLDADILGVSRTESEFDKIVLREKSNIFRPVPKNPFIPTEKGQCDEYLDELFEMQARSLAGRMSAASIKKAVVGVSGGLDSTLALLVGAKAMDILGLPQENLIGISMPGFGTTDRTYNNALALIASLGAQSREIPISKSVLQHFEDIGHDKDIHDITYENAQARERCQILLDVANAVGGLVIGTGDLTEEALGWCTFGGDHLSSYNVNTSITKTVARMIVKRLCDTGAFPESVDILIDILDTPVSPELIPPDENGNILQKTEKILGPYELHEFFTFYFVKYSMAPSKIYAYAIEAFEDEYSPQFIKQTLRTFLKRHFAGQFKRSCAPDCADIGNLSVGPNSYKIPSDLSSGFFLQELEENCI